MVIFLHILAHHSKNHVIRFMFKRFGEIVSRYFNLVLNAILRLQQTLLRGLDLVPDDCLDERWK